MAMAIGNKNRRSKGPRHLNKRGSLSTFIAAGLSFCFFRSFSCRFPVRSGFIDIFGAQRGMLVTVEGASIAARGARGWGQAGEKFVNFMGRFRE